MTKQEFAVAIDYNGLSKANLLAVAIALSENLDTIPTAMEKAVSSGTLSRAQANFLEALRPVRGDEWVESSALSASVSPETVELASLVRDWIAQNRGALEVEIRRQFPEITDEVWPDIKRYLINSKLIQTAFR